MRGYVGIIGFVSIIISLSLITYGTLLIMNGVQTQYSIIEVPTYNFETVGPGNVTVTKTETVYQETIKERRLEPYESIEIVFDIAENKGIFTMSGMYGVYIDSADFPSLGMNLYKLVNGSWQQVSLDFIIEGGAKSVGDELGYKYFQEGKFSANLANFIPGHFKLVATSNQSAHVRLFDLNVQHIRNETIYYPYPVLQVHYSQDLYRLLSDISLQNMQEGIAITVVGIVILLVYSSLATTLLLRKQ